MFLAEKASTEVLVRECMECLRNRKEAGVTGATVQGRVAKGKLKKVAEARKMFLATLKLGILFRVPSEATGMWEPKRNMT